MPGPKHCVGLAIACLIASCASSLPSDIPLGGIVPPARDEAHHRSAAPNREPRFEVSGNEGGATGSDEAEEFDEEEAADTIEITAEATAPVADGASPATSPPPTCDDSGGSEPSCGDLQNGACGSLFGPLCEQLGKALKPKVAGAVVACLVENNRSSHCDSIQECLEAGLEKACITPDDRRVCQSFRDRCGEPPAGSAWEDPEKCAQGVASLKKPMRAKLVKCLESGCDLDRCFLRIAE